MPGSLIADAPIWLQAPFILAWGSCVVTALHIIRETWFHPDPFGRVDLIPVAHEGRIVPLEAERDREWKEIA